MRRDGKGSKKAWAYIYAPRSKEEALMPPEYNIRGPKIAEQEDGKTIVLTIPSLDPEKDGIMVYLRDNKIVLEGRGIIEASTEHGSVKAQYIVIRPVKD